MAGPTVRTNRYAGPCDVCGQTVEANTGLWSRKRGAHHRPGRYVGPPWDARWVGGCPERDTREDAR